MLLHIKDRLALNPLPNSVPRHLHPPWNHLFLLALQLLVLLILDLRGHLVQLCVPLLLHHRLPFKLAVAPFQDVFGNGFLIIMTRLYHRCHSMSLTRHA